MTRIVDAHMHIYESKAQGHRNKANYQIWEYGSKPSQRFTQYGGDVEDALTAMRDASYDHGVVVNLFAVAREKDAAVTRLPAELQGEDRKRAIADIEATMGERIRKSNQWVVDLCKEQPKLTAFVSADPWALSPDEGVEHLRDMVENHGARGIKMHNVLQDFDANDERMHPIYRACIDLGIAVVAHSGPGRLGQTYAEPQAFAGVLRNFPDLKLVLAHMGGGAWKQTLEIANAFPNVRFDLCEVIGWVNASNAPNWEQFAKLILEIGPHRVLGGTDFPWYDLDRTVGEIAGLPHLAWEQKEMILGENAIELFGLTV